MKLQTIGWSQRELAYRLGCDSTTPSYWARGMVEVPKPLAEWLTDYAKYIDAHPPPTDWRNNWKQEKPHRIRSRPRRK